MTGNDHVTIERIEDAADRDRYAVLVRHRERLNHRRQWSDNVTEAHRDRRIKSKRYGAHR